MPIFQVGVGVMHHITAKKKDVPGYSPRNAFFMRSKIDS
ncbi:hypothetical protein J2T14_000549 [Paenibacillus harenae]|nr:hypothetical protein [Paenibacillus harenae]